MQRDPLAEAEAFASQALVALNQAACPGGPGHEWRPGGGVVVSAAYCDRCVQSTLTAAWLLGWAARGVTDPAGADQKRR